MKIGVMDTSGEIGGLALLQGEALMAESRIRFTLTHSRQLWRVLLFLLREVGWTLEELDGWVVSSGPGSFTGIRIGLATVKGLSLATGKPAAAVSTLETLASAWESVPLLIVPVVDARKQEVYYAGFRPRTGNGVEPVLAPAHGRPEELADRINEPALLVGSGAWLYRETLQQRLGPRACIPSWPHHLPSLRIQGALGLERIRQGGGDAPRDLHPLYVRPPDAQLARQSGRP